MKKWILLSVVALLITSLTACIPVEQLVALGLLEPSNVTTGTTNTTVTTFGPTVTTITTVGTTAPTISTPPVTQPTTLPTTVPATKPANPVGWQQENGKWCYYDDQGNKAIGLMEINGGMYYFDATGAMHTGWLDQEEGRYFFSPGGVMQFGWISVEGNRYYMGQDGLMRTGWQDIDNKRYYLQEDGTVHIGWLVLENAVYYLHPNGVMAKGMVEIEGEKNYFTSSGAYIMLVNPWNYMPEGYEPELKVLNRHNYNEQKVDAICYDALLQMLDDCKRLCQSAVVLSSYRTQEFQIYNYNRKVQYYLDLGYERSEAERLAAQVVAVPGTSEHQLGLAVDIVDNGYWGLDEKQATMPAQKWLMENSWKYGFILRYPVGKTDVTGIIYEPWHYRYVGKEVAKEIYELGLTLEEYMDMLTEEANT